MLELGIGGACPERNAAHPSCGFARAQHGPRRVTDCAAQHAGAKRQPRTGSPAFDVRPMLTLCVELKKLTWTLNRQTQFCSLKTLTCPVLELRALGDFAAVNTH